MDTRSIRPTLDALRHLPVGEVITLPAEHLALLQSDAREALEADGIVGPLTWAALLDHAEPDGPEAPGEARTGFRSRRKP